MVVAGAAARIARMVAAKCAAPPSARSSRSTEVTTTCLRPSLATACATRSGSAASSAPGRPVFTLQKAQARVQVSPMIIMVAWRFSQHSPIFGQPASSQTVCRRCSRTMLGGARIARRARRLHANPRRLALHGVSGRPFRDAASCWRYRAPRCLRAPRRLRVYPRELPSAHASLRLSAGISPRQLISQTGGPSASPPGSEGA